jgi:hypothetical protein
VSQSPSNTRPFDAPEFILTQRHRHPTRGHAFCPRVLYSLNPPFWPNSGTFRLPVSRCYTKRPRRVRFALPEVIPDPGTREKEYVVDRLFDAQMYDMGQILYRSAGLAMIQLRILGKKKTNLQSTLVVATGALTDFRPSKGNIPRTNDTSGQHRSRPLQHPSSPFSYLDLSSPLRSPHHHPNAS